MSQQISFDIISLDNNSKPDIQNLYRIAKLVSSTWFRDMLDFNIYFSPGFHPDRLIQSGYLREDV